VDFVSHAHAEALADARGSLKSALDACVHFAPQKCLWSVLGSNLEQQDKCVNGFDKFTLVPALLIKS
jgi:vacuolar-type H+-ATPase subunit D/Vma8